MNLRIAVMLALSLVGCGKDDDSTAPVTGTAPTTTPPATVITELGTPMWSVTDVALFSGPLEPSAGDCLFADRHVWDGTVWSPGTAHPAPYADELTGAMAGCGFVAAQTFAAEEMQAGGAIWLGLVVEARPGNAPGSSPDFPLGDVIYFDRFPFVVDADVRRDGILVDTDNDASFPGPDAWGFVVTGLSHLPLLFRTAHERMPAGASPGGDYTWQVALRDDTSIQGDQGYDVAVPYTVSPPVETE